MKHLLAKISLIGLLALFIVTSIQPVAWGAGFERHDVTFKSQGLDCAGWYYLPKDLKPEETRPAIVMAHGFSLVKEMGLDKFAEKFTEAGFVVLVFDYRYLGASQGEPRGQLFYYEQQQDYRNAISWLSLQKEVDAERIGMWGTSFAGGHVLQVAAFDKRVKAVVSQVPATNEWETNYQNLDPKTLEQYNKWYVDNRMETYKTGVATYFPVVAKGQNSCMHQPESYAWVTEAAKTAPNWKNKVTVESLDVNKEYMPMAYINLISPTPLLMIVASNDILCPTEMEKKEFKRAGEPKKLVVVQGRHFDVYQGSAFAEASEAAVDWFKKYLKP